MLIPKWLLTAAWTLSWRCLRRLRLCVFPGALLASMLGTGTALAATADTVVFVEAPPGTTLTRERQTRPFSGKGYLRLFGATLVTPEGSASSAVLLPDSGIVVVIGPSTQVSFALPESTNDPEESEAALITVDRGWVQVVAGLERDRDRIRIVLPSASVVTSEAFNIRVQVLARAANRTSDVLVSVAAGLAQVWRTTDPTGTPTLIRAGQEQLITTASTPLALFSTGIAAPATDSTALAVAGDTSTVTLRAGELDAGAQLAQAVRAGEATQARPTALPANVDPSTSISPYTRPLLR